ncbi:SMP-30/gluconolactonase/LRE family protein [Sphingomonas corticis]|jgi:sugar lactone lactonase YvrE|uniref:SMP-30/gluconolactonase/LRE family protein n=1 Tax=Sphingomonas corticis TaxID=2722791 RepID=A0ABX1CSN9_9SPHN|nr:SMP-30/gluconolactonase/LRE family protein [Sphingomonas corticis]NJR79638.1 SMP-30/gluconolactonase/LRE family protein [Sphingomonas corticis]
MPSPRIIARDRRDTLGEGPMWSAREEAVYWVDILGRRLNRLSLRDDAVTSFEMPDVIGWAIEREDALGFVAGIGRRFVRLTLDPVTIETIAAPEDDRDGNRFNDAKADAKGRIWAGSMPFTCDRPTGSLYRLDTDGSATRADDGYTIANGPAIPPGGDFLLHTDTAEATVYRYAVRDDGSLADRTPFIVFDADWGNPDGMTFDADGGLWVACWGGSCVRRFDADGRFDRRIDLPASQITSCTFAGTNLDRMFVTSAADGVDEPAGGCLFEVDPGCRGLPTPRYRG